jgi:hypothetical protein
MNLSLGLGGFQGIAQQVSYCHLEEMFVQQAVHGISMKPGHQVNVFALEISLQHIQDVPDNFIQVCLGKE